MIRIVLNNLPGHDCLEELGESDVLMLHFPSGMKGQPVASTGCLKANVIEYRRFIGRIDRIHLHPEDQCTA